MVPTNHSSPRPFSGGPMTSEPLQPQNPVLRCADHLEAALDEACDANPVFLSTDAKREALVRLARVKSRIAGLELSVLAVSGDIAEEEAARDAGNWLAAATRQDPGPSHGRVKLAQALDTRWARVAAGLAEGSVNAEQAQVVVRALDRLTEPLPPDPLHPERGAEPRDISREVLAAVEQALVDACRVHPPRELKAIGEKILESVAPTIAEQDELRRLEREEQRASAATRLQLRQRGDGSTDITGRIPDAVASRLRTYLRAFTAPRHDATTRGDEPSRFLDPTTGQRLPADRVPGRPCACSSTPPARPGCRSTAERPPKVIVTIDLDTLMSERGIAHLGDGTPITAGQARRMACQAGILPAVLNGKSEVLDLGREQRLYSPAQRTALGLIHNHCRAEHCSVPATWCEAHHQTPWSAHGETNLDDGVLLCPWHHQRAHDIRYRHERLPNGDVRFSRRT